MSQRSLPWRLFPSYVGLAIVAALVFGWLAVGFEERSLVNLAREGLEARATFLDAELGSEIPENRQDFARLCRRLGDANQARIAILLPDGVVDVDSRNRPEELEGRLERPEVARALQQQTGTAVRYNEASDRRVLYLATPILRHDQLFGVLYQSLPLTGIDATVGELQRRLALATAAITALAGLLAWWMGNSLGKPLSDLRLAAKRLADGQLSARVPVADTRELTDASLAFNHMADQLQRRIGTLVQNNNEQKAVLASMAEGVLAVDSRERIISMNASCGRLLGVDQSQIHGRPLREVVRNADLSRFVGRAVVENDLVDDDILMLSPRQRVMQAHGSALHDLENRQIGAVIVLNDVTDLRRLENIRRDFVANVSHELKTPITSIKGFVETLLDGASKDPADTERFLRIVAKQADRLHAIIEDLLSLSKIEQSEDNDDIVLERGRLRPVLESALAACQLAATDRSIGITLNCSTDLMAKMNPILLEQAVVNLLDNAIKYSPDGREVNLSADIQENEVAIRVTDHGAGIASEHVPRIFERFYRVDPARSRKMGGTGLGLAIVKHIVQAHRGRVTVDSVLGRGSTFTIFLPQ